MGYERISYFNQKKAASVFAAYCGIALQEIRVSHGVKISRWPQLFYTEKYECKT